MLFFLLFVCTAAFSQQDSFYLWPQEVPLMKEHQLEESSTYREVLRVKDVTNPMLTAYLPPEDKATGASVVICPGGGYRILAIEHEGYDFARWFSERGIAAFVLKYRLPNDAVMEQKEIVPLMDAQQALRIVRKRAGEWGLNARKVGIMGFSAGGHLAATAGTHFGEVVGGIADTTSVRPDFMILAYPVVSMLETLTHKGSRRALLGEDPSLKKVYHFSNERQVTGQTPPTFIVHTTDDRAVPAENSVALYWALREHGVPAEMHIYEDGGHGFGMAEGKGDLASWPERLQAWLRRRGLGQ